MKNKDLQGKENKRKEKWTEDEEEKEEDEREERDRWKGGNIEKKKKMGERKR